MRLVQQLRDLWKRIQAVFKEALGTARKRWRRSWVGRIAWPWLRSELEIVAKVSGVVLLSLWAKRLIEQWLEARVLNEAILGGAMNDVVRDIEQDVLTRRADHGRRKR